MPRATAMPIRGLRKRSGFSGVFPPDPDARVVVATVAVKKPGQQCPESPGQARRDDGLGGNPPPNHPAVYCQLLALLLQLLCPASLAVLLDCRLRQVLVLGADHSENRSRAVAATRNRTELDRTFPPLANDNTAANAYCAPASIQCVQRRFARARYDFRLDDGRQFVHELLNDFLKIRTSSHLISPCMSGRRLASKRDARNP